jgi:site-specific DNA recombinase
MKVAIYARVSSENQAQQGSIESQLEALRVHAKAQGFTILEECLDDGYSGTNLVRPALDRIRDLAAQGLIEAVLVLSPDRLSRNYAHQVILEEEFDRRGIKLLFTNKQIGDTPEDKLLLGMQGLFAEYERTKILDRTRRGRLMRARQGRLGGGNVPYGYRRINKTKDAPPKWEINPEEAQVVRLAFRLVTDDHYSLRKVARYLQEHTYPTRSGDHHWRTSLLAHMLRCEAYAGTTYVYKSRATEPRRSRLSNPYSKRRNHSSTLRPREEWIPIPVPAIIDRQTLEAARVQLDHNAKVSARNNWKNEYLLRTLVQCGICGSHICGVSRRGKVFYKCSPWSHRETALRHDDQPIAVARDVLDRRVWDSLVELVSDPSNIRDQLAKRLHAYSARTDQTQQEVHAHQEALQRLATEEERLVDAYRAQVISLGQLKTQLKKVNDKRTRLNDEKDRLQAHQESLGHPEITLRDLGDVSARLKRAMTRTDFQTRQRIVQALVNSVTLYPGRAVVSGVLPLNGNIPNDARLLRSPFPKAKTEAF